MKTLRNSFLVLFGAGDVYITNGLVKYAIEQASPCPADCPFTLRETVMNAADVPTTGPINTNPTLNPNKLLLVRLWDVDPRQ